jgi:hypothetical protein
MSVEPGVLDANVLAYAVNADAPQHAASRALLDAAGDPSIALRGKAFVIMPSSKKSAVLLTNALINPVNPLLIDDDRGNGRADKLRSNGVCPLNCNKPSGYAHVVSLVPLRQDRLKPFDRIADANNFNATITVCSIVSATFRVTESSRGTRQREVANNPKSGKFNSVHLQFVVYLASNDD